MAKSLEIKQKLNKLLDLISERSAVQGLVENSKNAVKESEEVIKKMEGKLKKAKKKHEIKDIELQIVEVQLNADKEKELIKSSEIDLKNLRIDYDNLLEVLRKKGIDLPSTKDIAKNKKDEFMITNIQKQLQLLDVTEKMEDVEEEVGGEEVGVHKLFTKLNSKLGSVFNLEGTKYKLMKEGMSSPDSLSISVIKNKPMELEQAKIVYKPVVDEIINHVGGDINVMGYSIILDKSKKDDGFLIRVVGKDFFIRGDVTKTIPDDQFIVKNEPPVFTVSKSDGTTTDFVKKIVKTPSLITKEEIIDIVDKDPKMIDVLEKVITDRLFIEGGISKEDYDELKEKINLIKFGADYKTTKKLYQRLTKRNPYKPTQRNIQQ